MCALPGSAEESESAGKINSLLPISKIPGLKLGKIILNPYLQAGFTQVASNISFPLGVEEVIPINNQLEIGTMELSMQDALFWTGNAGLNVVLGESLALFGAAGGFLPRPIGAPAILPMRINNITLPSQLEFTGNQVEYWNVQLGASLSMCGGWSVLGGYFWDHFGMVAQDPRIGDIPLGNQTIRADFLTLTGAPFIGLQFSLPQLSYRFSLLYSPLAQCNATMALRNSQVNLSQLKYTFNRPGNFFVFNGEYDWSMSKTSYFSVWATALWMKVQGSGTMEFTSPTRGISAVRDESNASLTKYSIAGGVGLGLLF